MADETYEGWKNFPTWVVNLWLMNEEPLYRSTLELVENAIRMAGDDLSGNIASGIWTLEEATRYEVGEQIHEAVECLAEEEYRNPSSFTNDLLGYAMRMIEWGEVADAWIEIVAENAASTESPR